MAILRTPSAISLQKLIAMLLPVYMLPIPRLGLVRRRLATADAADLENTYEPAIVGSDQDRTSNNDSRSTPAAIGQNRAANKKYQSWNCNIEQQFQVRCLAD